MPGEIDVFNRFGEIAEQMQMPIPMGNSSEATRKITEHKNWLKSIRRERPSPSTEYNVGIYIRYFNQTKYDNYLFYHKKQFDDTLALCPKWKLVDYYIDDGSSAPNIESAPELCRLIDDCYSNKVNLIITQKISNMSKKPQEIALLSRLLAANTKNPVGIYFVSEDLFTFASYYMEDLKDEFFLPAPDWEPLPDDDIDKEIETRYLS